MSAHTPGPCKECRIKYGHGRDVDYYVDFCPLHAAAPALLEALEDLLDLGRAGYIYGDDMAVTRAVEDGYAALRAAQGGPGMMKFEDIKKMVRSIERMARAGNTPKDLPCADGHGVAICYICPTDRAAKGEPA